jgi:hypothetical protein
VGGIAISFQALALRAACSARMPVACAVCRGLSWAVLGCLGLSHERVGGTAGVTPAARYACLAVRASRQYAGSGARNGNHWSDAVCAGYAGYQHDLAGDRLFT